MTSAPETVTGKAEAMAAEQALLLVGFARACRAAARAIALYPPEHPTVGSTLGHVVEAATAAAAACELRMSVLPDTFTVDGRRLAKPDQAASELAAQLHLHQVGQLNVLPQSAADEWRRFLTLVALPPDQTRRRGGLARLWTNEGQARIVVRQIDYETLLQGRLQGEHATWTAIVANCLEGDAHACDDWLTNLLLEVLDRPEDASRLLEALEQRTSATSGRAPVVMAGLLRAMAEFVRKTQPDELERVFKAMAEVASRLPTEALAGMAAHGRSADQPELAAFLSNLAEHMTDEALAERVVQAVTSGQGGSAALADFLAGFVPEASRRSSILAIARHALEHADASTETPGDIRAEVERLLAAHDDTPFVSDEYAKELWRAAERAVDLDHDATDSEALVAAWTASVSDGRIRLLDARLLVDMLQLKRELAAWRDMAALAVARVGVLVVVGDFDAAAFLVEALRLQQEDHPNRAIREAAGQTLDDLLNADLMRHVASHLDTMDSTVVVGAKRFCQAVGPPVVPLLAEVLSREDRTRTRQHLIGILTAFGAEGRHVVERLMQSPKAAVRRTAVLLLREFGGDDALPQLESMLHDEEPHVQREATRAIALLGIEPAYETLTRALLKGTETSRTAVTGVLCALPPEETVPVLAHLVTRAPLGGVMRPVQERALQRLGATRGPAAVAALGEALQRGSLMAPMRSLTLRRLAAASLARIGTDEAIEQLHAAAVGGTWSMRAAARAALNSIRRDGAGREP